MAVGLFTKRTWRSDFPQIQVIMPSGSVLSVNTGVLPCVECNANYFSAVPSRTFRQGSFLLYIPIRQYNQVGADDIDWLLEHSIFLPSNVIIFYWRSHFSPVAAFRQQLHDKNRFHNLNHNVFHIFIFVNGQKIQRQILVCDKDFWLRILTWDYVYLNALFNM